MAVKQTLLDLTQNILEAINGSEVNSIADTVEALQVASEIRNTYYIILQDLSLDTRKSAIQLGALSDTSHPTMMRIPENVINLDWIKYNYKTDGYDTWVDVRYLPPEDFIRRSSALASQTSVGSQLELDSGAPLYYKTDQNPKYYTTFDDEYLVFDAIDTSLDDTLQNSKTLCWGSVIPDFSLSDDFIPDLRADLFPRLLAEAKASCFILIKQVSNAKEEQRSRRMAVQLQNRRSRLRVKDSNSRAPNDYSRP